MWAVKSMYLFAAIAMFFFTYEYAKFFVVNIPWLTILAVPMAGIGIVMLTLVFSRD